MDRPSLSYIVPVYNTADLLHDCLGSIAWSGADTECVAVDDGSTDSSPGIIREFTDSDNRFRAVTQDNRGLSAARNRGLSEARGRYILFVDSDDFVDADAIGEMLEMALESDADIVTGNLICVDPSGEMSHWGTPVTPGTNTTGADFLRHMHAEATYFPMAPCYMVRKELLQERGIMFREGIMHEDELWAPTLLMHAGKTIASGANHYGYRTEREGTLTHRPDPAFRFYSLISVIGGIIDCVLEFSTDSDTIGKCAPFLKWRLTVLRSICEEIAGRREDQEMNRMLSEATGRIRAFASWLGGEEAGESGR